MLALVHMLSGIPGEFGNNPHFNLEIQWIGMVV